MTDDADDPDRPTLRREWKGDAGEDAHTGPLYAPDEVEATRLRQQGIGVGAEELRLQRDPTGAATTPEMRERSGATADQEAERTGPAEPRPDPRH